MSHDPQQTTTHAGASHSSPSGRRPWWMRVIKPALLAVLINAAAGLVVAGLVPILVKNPMISAPEWASVWFVCGGAGLFGLIAGWVTMRPRIRGLVNVREALLASRTAGEHLELLGVDAGTPEADAWNRVVAGEMHAIEEAITDAVAHGIRSGTGSASGGGLVQSACDALSQGIVVLDEDGAVRYANGAAAIFLSVRRADLVGKKINTIVRTNELIAAIEGACVVPGKRAAVEVARAALGENPEEGDDGTLRFHLRPLRGADSARAVMLIEDITQQRVADESHSRFVAHATHELRTPLTNIRLYVEELLDRPEDEELRAKGMNVINHEVRRLERVISEMLSVSEIEAGSFSLNKGDVRVDAMFAELREDYQAQADEKDITLEWALPPKLPVVPGDRDKLSMALHNLIGNALKYTPAGGKVTVAVTEDDGFFVAEVTDTGIGIGEDDLKRIFDRFYRAKDKRVSHVTGTGLGLAIAREVIRLHGGDIEATSELDQGSRFKLTVPMDSRAA